MGGPHHEATGEHNGEDRCHRNHERPWRRASVLSVEAAIGETLGGAAMIGDIDTAPSPTNDRSKPKPRSPWPKTSSATVTESVWSDSPKNPIIETARTAVRMPSLRNGIAGCTRELVKRPHPTFRSPVQDVEAHERKPGEHSAVADRIDEERPAGTKPRDRGTAQRRADHAGRIELCRVEGDPSEQLFTRDDLTTIACQAGRLRPAVMPTSTETAT